MEIIHLLLVCVSFFISYLLLLMRSADGYATQFPNFHWCPLGHGLGCSLLPCSFSEGKRLWKLSGLRWFLNSDLSPPLEPTGEVWLVRFIIHLLLVSSSYGSLLG